MSGWTTLNIDGISPAELPEAFADWWVYKRDGRTVVYSFNPHMGPKEAADEVVKAGDTDVEPVVESVLCLRCNDTSDFVTGIIFHPEEVKWNGVRPGVTWSGHHSWRDDDSEFLQRMPEGLRPIFAGNWKKISESQSGQLLSDLIAREESDAEQ